MTTGKGEEKGGVKVEKEYTFFFTSFCQTQTKKKEE
jgi:hypothetical protein